MHYTLFLILSLLLQHLNAALPPGMEPWLQYLHGTLYPTHASQAVPWLQHLNADADLGPKVIGLSEPSDLVSLVRDSFEGADFRLIILDNDGVLVPANVKPEKHHYDHARNLLGMLVGYPKTQVWVNSVRGVKHLRNEYGRIDNLNLAGRSGLEIMSKVIKKTPLKNVSNEVEALLNAIVEEVARRTGYRVPSQSEEGQNGVTLRFPGSFVYYFLPGENRLNKAMQQVMQHASEYLPYEYGELTNSIGQRSASLTHHENSKGAFAAHLLALNSQNLNKKSFVISMGDQQVDESMHRAVNAFSNFKFHPTTRFSVFISDNDYSETHAKARLLSYAENRTFWNSLFVSLQASTS